MTVEKDMLITAASPTCPVCETEGSVVVRSRVCELQVKKEILSVEELYYYCSCCESEFCFVEMMDLNFKNANEIFESLKG